MESCKINAEVDIEDQEITDGQVRRKKKLQVRVTGEWT